MQRTIIHLERTFDSSHIIPGHPGKCGRLHGHTYRVQVWIEGVVNPATAMLVDFFDVKRTIDAWDHVHLNDVVDFTPTAELLAEELQRRMLNLAREASPEPEYCNCVVRLWETTSAYAQVGTLADSSAAPALDAAVFASS
jgi:6-pyruvoyltetrahydropterin/6-carboxytetrahydropterin synthase